MSRRNVHIVSGGGAYTTMYVNNGWAVVSDIRDADLVHFTGGEDVTPVLYGQHPHPRTYNSVSRDQAETKVWLQALSMGVPMVGECRGGQFLNVMCGGEMWQHVDGHANGSTHVMVDVKTGRMFPVTSTHHQMMKPHHSARVLGVASEASCLEYMVGEDVAKYYPKRGDDIEVVYYEKHRCLCFQPHPEYMSKEDECQQYFFELVEDLVCVD